MTLCLISTLVVYKIRVCSVSVYTDTRAKHSCLYTPQIDMSKSVSRIAVIKF